ncbi:MAG: archaellin/type IV pilin N-terminal domain-containing protein [Methanomassiliicoccales archaeon]|jgi:flagellin FlaB
MMMKRKLDKRAEMGVGTMIIFIAMVLVAAVAASVLISTANDVREQAQDTGSQAIDNVATGFICYDVVGTASVTDGTLTSVDVYLRLQSGSPSINMENVLIAVNDGNQNLLYNYTGTTPLYTAGQVVAVSGADWTADAVKMVGQGDMIKITIDLSQLTDDVENSQYVQITITPAYGQATMVAFYTPEVFTTAMVDLA